MESQYHFDANLVKLLYWEDKLSIQVIADRLVLPEWYIQRKMQELGIPRRSASEANHLARSNHVTLTPELLSFVEGHLLGDGSLTSGSRYSARYSQTSKFKKYLLWVESHLLKFGVERVGRITKHQVDHPGFQPSDVFNYASRSYVELRALRESWYNPRKQPPNSFQLNPTSLLMWYLDDGSYTPTRFRKRGREKGTAFLANLGFAMERKEFLASQIRNLDLACTVTKEGIRISSSHTMRFFQTIGPCPLPSYFGHKWPREILDNQICLPFYSFYPTAERQNRFTAARDKQLDLF